MEEIKKEDLIDKIGFFTIIITIILLSICIGASIKNPLWIIQTLASVVSIIYIVIKKIRKEKNVIIKGKIDIAVLVFMMATIIPYISKVYVSLEGTINFILKYWSIFGIYILTRNTVSSKKDIKFIANTIIASSIIPIIIGYDKLTFNALSFILKAIDGVNIDGDRMISSFGYANTFAVYLSITASLAISQFVSSEKKKNKIIYGIYIVIACITIVLTQSKAVLALIALSIMFIIIKGIKNKKIGKKAIIAGITIGVLFCIYFFISIKWDKPFVVAGKNKERVFTIREIEPNTKYKFEFDIETKTDKTYDTFEIMVIEVSRYFSEKTVIHTKIGEYNGTKTFEFQTGLMADHVRLIVKNLIDGEIAINEFRINDEKYALDYKITKEEFVRIFTTFNFKYSSVWQRGDYWKTSLEIIKDNWFLGSGGNAWENLYGQKQEYLYYAKECHSYMLEVWMSFGLIGIISYIYIVAITIKNVTKLEKNEIILAIMEGMVILTLHSIIDFDMSFLIIAMFFYIFIAILNKEDKKLYLSHSNICEYIVIVILGITIVGNIYGLTGNAIWMKKNQYEKIEQNEEIRMIKRYIKNEQYSAQSYMYKRMSEQILKKDNLKEELENIDFLINTWQNIKRERTYDGCMIISIAKTMANFAEGLLEKSNEEEIKDRAIKIINIIKQQYNGNAKIILDYQKTGETESLAKIRLENYLKIVKKYNEM